MRATTAIAGRAWIGVLVGLLATLASSTAAKAAEIPPCVVPLGVVQVPSSLTPQAVLQELKVLFHEEPVAPNEEFDVSDMRVIGRHTRFIFVWNSGTKWIVAIEFGGLGYGTSVFAFQLSDDGRTAVRLTEKGALPRSVCSAAYDLVALQ